MYQIVALELGPQRKNSRRWTIASGFQDSSAALATLSRWAEQHFPQALQDQYSQFWLVEDETGPQICYFIELAPVVDGTATGQ